MTVFDAEESAGSSAGTMTLFHVTCAENLESIRQHGIVPAVGERSAELREAHAAVYTFCSLEDVVTALSNWLGEAFEDDEELIIIKMQVPASWVITEAFEYRIYRTVPAHHFVCVLSEDDLL